MEKIPAISVVIPVYNCERYLKQCLDSVLAQSFQDIEIICVDDQSSDRSVEILSEYAAKYPNLSVYRLKNRGVSSTRNYGVKQATGKYIYYIDGDDYLLPDALEKAFMRAEQAEAEITMFGFKFFWENTKTYSYYRDVVLYHQLRERVFSVRSVPEIISCAAVWDRLFLRSFILENNIKFADGYLYEDLLYTVETLIHAKRVAMVPDNLYVYRKDIPTSITGTEKNSLRHRNDFIEMYKRANQLLENASVDDRVMESHLNLFVKSAIVHCLGCVKEKDFICFFNSLREILNERHYEICVNLPDKPFREFAEYLRVQDPKSAKRMIDNTFKQ